MHEINYRRQINKDYLLTDLEFQNFSHWFKIRFAYKLNY